MKEIIDETNFTNAEKSALWKTLSREQGRQATDWKMYFQAQLFKIHKELLKLKTNIKKWGKYLNSLLTTN